MIADVSFPRSFLDLSRVPRWRFGRWGQDYICHCCPVELCTMKYTFRAVWCVWPLSIWNGAWAAELSMTNNWSVSNHMWLVAVMLDVAHVWLFICIFRNPRTVLCMQNKPRKYCWRKQESLRCGVILAVCFLPIFHAVWFLSWIRWFIYLSTTNALGHTKMNKHGLFLRGIWTWWVNM